MLDANGEVIELINDTVCQDMIASGVITGMAVGRGDMGKLKEYVRTMQLLFLTIGVITIVAAVPCWIVYVLMYLGCAALVLMDNVFIRMG